MMPDIAPKGLTTVLTLIIFFGAINLLGVSIVGEYLGKVLEEVKRRPHYIRKHLVRDGRVLEIHDDSRAAE